ncbi:MAG: cytochrome c maturation protein CcmE [Myxococcales bacterium]
MPPVVDERTPARGAAWKIVLSVVVVTGAVGFLLSRSMKEGAEYYKHVDEVMAAPDTLRAKRLQVHGHVVNDSIEQAKGTLQYRFKIESRAPRAPAVISANYTGLVPDTFKSGAEVVAKGTIGADNVLQVVPDGIMAKCPSKYDAAKAGGSNPAAGAAAAPTATVAREAPRP